MKDRKAASSWPFVLIPEPGHFPPVATIRDERVLHVSLKTSFEKQPGLVHALSSLGPYAEVDWLTSERARTLNNDLLAAAAKHKPSIVFMQLQRETSINPTTIEKMKALCRHDVVVVNWDGDQHHQPKDPQRQWFVELGRACDTSLVVNTLHPHIYRDLGVRNPGYLQIGIDERFFPRKRPAETTDVVMLASCYPQLPAYTKRQLTIKMLQETLFQRFSIYGLGWHQWPGGRSMLKQHEEAAVYLGAKAAISMSICNDLPRYSSDRLFRALAAGAVTLVEEFPDMEGLGLKDHDNCIFWKTHDDLLHAIDEACASPDKNIDIRKKAHTLASSLHTWRARMPELGAIVETVRKTREKLL